MIVNAVFINYNNVSDASCSTINTIPQNTCLHWNKERITQRPAKHEVQHDQKTTKTNVAAQSVQGNAGLNFKYGFATELVEVHIVQVQPEGLSVTFNYQELFVLQFPMSLVECNGHVNLSTLQMEGLPIHLELSIYLTKLPVNLTVGHSVDIQTELEHSNNSVHYVLKDDGAVVDITLPAIESILTYTIVCLQPFSQRELCEQTVFEMGKVLHWFKIHTRLMVFLQYLVNVSLVKEETVQQFCNGNMLDCCISPPTPSYNGHLCIVALHQGATSGDIPNLTLFQCHINGAADQLVCKYREMNATTDFIINASYRVCFDISDPICHPYCKVTLKINVKLDIQGKSQERNISWELYLGSYIPVLVNSVQCNSVGVRCNSMTTGCCYISYVDHLFHTSPSQCSACRGLILIMKWHFCTNATDEHIITTLQVILTPCCNYLTINTLFLGSLENFPVLNCDLKHYQYYVSIRSDYPMTMLQTHDHFDYNQPAETLKIPITVCMFNTAVLSSTASQPWLVHHQSNINCLCSLNIRDVAELSGYDGLTECKMSLSTLYTVMKYLLKLNVL